MEVPPASETPRLGRETPPTERDANNSCTECRAVPSQKPWTARINQALRCIVMGLGIVGGWHRQRVSVWTGGLVAECCVEFS